MKISYVSDLHLDFHVPFKSNQIKWQQGTEELTLNLINTDKGEKDVLIIAGDTSHFNRQSLWAVTVFSQHYNHVIITVGNHDYYLISKSQQDKYKNNSQNRIDELYNILSEIPNVHPLFTDEIFTYNDIKFGGNPMWYPLGTYEQKTFFYNNSNDSRLIRGTDIEIEYMLSMNNYNSMMSRGIDVMVSHVPIIPIDSHQLYGGDACYYTLVDELSPYIIQGHSHEQKIYSKAGSIICMNALGYPYENLDMSIKSLSI